MANLNTNLNKTDVVKESVGEGRVVEEEIGELRSGRVRRRVEESDDGNVEWEKGSVEYDRPGDEVLTDHSRASSGIPGPDDDDEYYEDMDYEFEAQRYGKRKYSQFDYDYMPMSDPEDVIAPAPSKISTAGRGKVSPTMHTWGLAEAMKEYEALRAKAMEEEKRQEEKSKRCTKKGKGKGKGQKKEQKKSAVNSDSFVSDANKYAEEVLEELERNPAQVPKEVCEAVEKEIRLRKEMEKEVDRELDASLVESEPVAGPSQPFATPRAGTAESLTSMDLGDLGDRPVEDLKALAATKLTTVMTVASKSGNLQGRYVRDLKDAAKSLREVIECLAVRPDGEELRRLKTANHNLRRELEELRRDMKDLRRELRERRPSPSPAPSAPPVPPLPQAPTPAIPPALQNFDPEEFLERIQRMVAVTCGNIVTARIDALGLPPPPVVRPPLAADSQTTSASAVPDVSRARVTEPQESWATVTRKGKKGKGKKTVAPPVVTAAPVSAVVASNSSTAAPPTAVAPIPPVQSAASTAPKLAARPKPKFVVPRSSAVVVTLEPEAIAKGVTYKDALIEARKSIPLEEMTVDRVSIRQTATGARIIELFGEDSATKADNLAVKMREKLSGVAKITRPVKCIDLRIVGLDDTIEKEEIIAVLVTKSGSSREQIKIGEVRPGPRGGSVIVSIPTLGAKKLLDEGRILIGWSSAQVQALDSRPLRCFKCMGVGHTRQLCPSPFDRSDICFRCGVFGHKAAGCFEEARCAVCEDADRPFRHTMGGRDCNPPPVKGKVVVPAVPGPAAPHERLQAEEEHENMSVQNSDRDSLEE